MKIAIFHDYFDEIGGAEISILSLARILNASIFTTNIDKEKIKKLGFQDVKIRSIGKVPKIKYLKQLIAQYRFSKLKINDYDLYIFAGSLSIHSSKNNFPNLWFCISPLRSIYDLRYFNSNKNNPLSQLIETIRIKLDQNAVKKINNILVSSKNVQGRIKKYYKRDSKIVYRPIETKDFYYNPPKNYWLSITRIDPYKRIELQIKAFNKIKDENLIIAGGVSKESKKYLKRLKKISKKNIKFLGPVYEKEKIAELYANSKGLVVSAKDEDFGRTPLEAMASGKPVIAPNEGGYKETIINNKTGILIDNIDENKLANAIEKITQKLKLNPLKYKKECVKQAKKFDTKIFIKKIKKEIFYSPPPI